MRSPLESRIASLRRKVRRTLALHGSGLVVGGLIAAAIVAGLADWLAHLAGNVRLVLLAATTTLGGLLIGRYVLRPLLIRFADLDIALKIERRWPGLNDRLASTLQFLRMTGPDSGLSGSRALRDATVTQTLKEVETIDFRQVIDPRPLRRSALFGLALSGLAAALLFAPSTKDSSRLALERLLHPLGKAEWPQQTHLTAKAPEKVARGETFALEVNVAHGERTPSTALVTYRFDDGEVASEKLRLDDRGVYHGRIESVSRSFTFAVAAGDDQTAPKAVAVVPPPALTDLAVRIVYPAYTALPPQTLAPGLTQVQAVRGSKVELSAVANKPLASASLAWSGPAAVAPKVAIDNTGKRLSTALSLAEAGSFWFDLRDREGFRSQEKDTTRYEARPIRDEAPRVVIEEPANDRDVTANADVPIKVVVDDDFGISTIQLPYRIAAGPGSEPTQQAIRNLYSGEPTRSHPEKHREATLMWSLADLKLEPGAVITFHAESRDFDEVSGPNLGKSREMRLRIVSPEQAAKDMEERRREVRDDIARTLAMEKQAITPVEDARRTLDQTEKLDTPVRDGLKNAEAIQRQVTNRIGNKTDGLEEKLRRMLADQKDLKLNTPDSEAQIRNLLAGAERIRQDHLGPAERELSNVAKNLENNDPAAADGAEPKAAAPDAEANKAEGSKAEPSKAEGSKSGEQAKPKSGESSKGEASKSQPGEASKAEAAKSSPDSNGKPPARISPRRPIPGRQKGCWRGPDQEQKAIADELQKMLDSQSEFETFRGMVQELKKTLKDQTEAGKAAAEAAAQPELTSKQAKDLSAEEKAALENVAAKQAEVAKNLEAVQNKMAEMAGRTEQSDPMGAQALKDAAEQSRKKNTAGKMGDAAEQIKKNQMGQAKANQDQAKKDLEELVNSLENRRENELSRLVKALKAAEAELKDIRAKQAKNKEDTSKAAQNKDAKQRQEELQNLAKEQKQLAEQTKKLLQKLSKLRAAENAMRAGSKAAAKMAKAGEQQDDDQGDEAAKEQEEALNDLKDAEDEVAEARRDAEEQLAMEQLSKLKDNLKGLVDRQEKVVEEAKIYDAKRIDGKALTPAERAGVRGLGRVQEALKDEAEEILKRLDDAPVFARTLKRAAERMDETAQRLQALKTDKETQVVARSAVDRVKQLLDALSPDKGGDGGQQAGGGGQQPGGGSGSGGGGDAVTKAAQVKLLKMLQQEINDRTESLDDLRARGKLTAEQEAEIDRLAEDQRGIADLARDMTKPKHADGEED